VGCPDDEELAALLSRSIDPRRRAEIVDHAAGCASCRVLVVELTGIADTVSATASTVRPAERGDRPGPAGRANGPHGAEAIRRSVVSALLACERQNKVGRYQLLEIVGVGGMGVVWGAWDPELARRIALKLVHPRVEAARDRILAEGQALGKLSHPNVVPIYDVGVIEDQVYLVMEWVQGTTLRAYAGEGASQRERIEAYRQAGEGLAAAHRAGLIHRDFKPDNAIRGDDGRVRVLDFGLARSDTEVPDPEHRVAGTPRYMAPEQAAGQPLTPAADQFAFTVSLREALTAGRPGELPGWLARIITRGTAADPAQRFPSMEALLAQLANDPARRWRRRAIAGAAAVAAIAAFVIGRTHTEAPATCVGSALEIAQSLPPASRAAMIDHLRGLGEFGAGEADRLAGELDAYGRTWAGEHQRACLAHERGELPGPLYARRLGCLARGKAALTTVAELMASVAADKLGAALVAARMLPSAAGCAAGDASPVPPPPDAAVARVAAIEPSVERARVLAIAAHADAIAVATSAVAAAEATGYAPLVARALVVRGRAEIELGLGELAPRASLERALDLSLRGADDVTAVEAYARLIWLVASYHGDVVGNWSVMEAIAARTGRAGRVGRALLYNNKAVARNAAGDRAGARPLLQQALADAPVTPIADADLELVAVQQNLALLSDDPAEREARAGQLVAYLEGVLGPHHDRTFQARGLAATLTRNPAVAAAHYQIACDGYQRWHPQRTRSIADCAFERAWLADERDDPAIARAAMQLVASDQLARAGGKGAIATSYLQITAGEAIPAAVTAMQALGDADARATEWWNRGEAADAYITAALGWDRLGKPGDAERSWRSALAMLEDLRQPMFDRRLARVRAVLARRWASVRPDDARRLAAEALAWYRTAGGYETTVDDLSGIEATR
jgi:eukaryotic-like serine/threonine-protein kinase